MKPTTIQPNIKNNLINEELSKMKKKPKTPFSTFILALSLCDVTKGTHHKDASLNKCKFFFWRIFSQPLQCKLIVYTFLNLSFVKYHANEADSARKVWPGKVHFPLFFARGSQRSSLKSLDVTPVSNLAQAEWTLLLKVIFLRPKRTPPSK